MSQSAGYKKAWRAWYAMMFRCYNPKYKYWDRYGGRGILVCMNWHRFEGFLQSMGLAPESMTLDRINTNGNYEPSNCRWASWTEQQNNRTDNRKLTSMGRTMTITQWSRETGLTRKTIEKRLDLDWDVDRALTEQVHLRSDKRLRKKRA